MRIDETHKPWAIFTAAATALGACVYVVYALRTVQPAGGTPVGLVFGVLALGLMLFAAALGIRKRFPVWRIGSARLWMRAHLWLGLLALPMVLFHAGFHARGALAAILLWLTILVVVSGLGGAFLQHILPTRMFREVPFETIYDQIPVIRAQLRTEAQARATEVIQSLAPQTGPGATVVDTLLEIKDMQGETAHFQHFVSHQIEPYLSAEGATGKDIANRQWSEVQFNNLRREFPEVAWPQLAALEEICEEKRQLDHQARLHRLLHAWLLVHLPLSAGLILLALIHAIGALRY